MKESKPFIIYYKVDFKYQLAKTYKVKTSILKYEIKMPFVTLLPDGLLIIKTGFGWNGASGPTIDTDTSMRGSLVHDAIYYLLRLGYLCEEDRYLADKLLEKICIEDGMFEIRADMWFKLVNLAGKPAADPKNKKKLYIAPDKYKHKLQEIT